MSVPTWEEGIENLALRERESFLRFLKTGLDFGLMEHARWTASEVEIERVDRKRKRNWERWKAWLHSGGWAEAERKYEEEHPEVYPGCHP